MSIPPIAPPVSAPSTASKDPNALPGTAFGRGVSQVTRYAPEPSVTEHQILLDRVGQPSRFTGSLDDAIAAVKQLNRDEAFRNQCSINGKKTTFLGDWKKTGDVFGSNTSRAILQDGESDTNWLIQPLQMITAAAGVTGFELDPRRGTAGPYNRHLTLTDLPSNAIAIVDKETVVNVVNSQAEATHTGTDYTLNTWVPWEPPPAPPAPAPERKRPAMI